MDLNFREAKRDDLERIVELIANDAVAARRTGSYGEPHIRGFEAVAASPDNELIVAELDGAVIGVMQLTFIPGISRNGASRLLVEAVRVESELRGQGIGRRLMEHAHERGRARGCTLAELTSDKRRTDAHRFYRSLGYEQSHEGFKLPL
ncbi:GNAT family N-acetyltransferase [Promicromonospora sp. NPDC057138]|uniref:GNAT family N-acetyltransferase n=1 Tax=Promicromonospora sp. NPDC057138 TaxID=3346031 RepID=UPI0036325DD7